MIHLLLKPLVAPLVASVISYAYNRSKILNQSLIARDEFMCDNSYHSRLNELILKINRD